MSRPFVPGWRAHWWSTGYSAWLSCLVSLVLSLVLGGVEGGPGGVAGPGTLLGPEGTAARVLLLVGCRGFVSSAWTGFPRVVAWRGRDRPYLENCTVDASIIYVVPS